MSQQISNIIQESIEVKQHILANPQFIARIDEAAQLITDALLQNKRIYFCGNGGSAADAQHLAAEFSGRFYHDRKSLPAEALHCNTSYITAVGNDYGYEFIYSRLIEGIAHTGDVLVGISTSGNSKNITEAYKVAHAKGLHIISLTGTSGGSMKDLSNILLNVPSNDTPRIQESHILIGHIICQLAEERYFNLQKK